MKYFMLMLIRFYQKVISPCFPPRCRFYPTCSAYAFTAIERFGAIRGGYLCAAPHFKVATRFIREAMIRYPKNWIETDNTTVLLQKWQTLPEMFRSGTFDN
mgnify:CR=1 FL=1